MMCQMPQAGLSETLNHNHEAWERMVSAEHQKLVNGLARGLEGKGIRITAIDMADTPKYFDQKYHKLPKPGDRDGRIPDLEGIGANGTINLGEAETDMGAENLNDQLKKFSNRVMIKTEVPVPLHVVVPSRIKSQMESRIRELGLGGKLATGEILIWS